MPSVTQPAISGIPVLIPSGEFQDQPVFPLDRVCTLVGEDPCCDLQLLAAATPGVHAAIITTIHGVFVRNFSQQGYLLVNGQPVREATLVNGCDLRIGRFTFKYFDNQAPFQPPTGLLPGGFEFNGAPPRAIGMRSALIGRAAQADIRSDDPNWADRHTVFFAANGIWHVRDLGSPAGTVINGQPLRQAELTGGDLIAIGSCTLRWNSEARPAAPRQQFPAFGGGDLMLGGMPVALPEVAKPPSNFGKVRVNFEGRVLKSKRDPGPAQLPPMPEFTTQESDGGSSESAEAELPRTPVLRRFPTVPKIKSQPAEQSDLEQEGIEQEYISPSGTFGVETIDGLGQPVLLGSEEATGGQSFGEGMQHLTGINDAAFGGQPFTAGEHPMMSEAPGQVEIPAEIEDFSENKFWDMTDDEQAEVPLPEREKDFAPPIPPVGTVFTLVGGDMGNVSATPVDEGNGEPITTTIPPSLGGGLPVTTTFQDHVFGEPMVSSSLPPAAEAEADVVPTATVDDSANRPQRASVPLELDRSPLRRPAPGAQLPPDVSSLVAPQIPHTPPPRTMVVLMSLMLLCMAGAVGWIWLIQPTHSTVEARFSYMNMPKPGTADLATLEAGQLKRLADAATIQSATQHLQLDSPHTDAGFLVAGSKPLADVLQTAHFDPRPDRGLDLVLNMPSIHANDDGQRLMDLLKGIFEVDNDLATAADAARKALVAWMPTVTAKQQDLDDLNTQIVRQQHLVAAGTAVEPNLKKLSDAADSAARKYLSAEQAIAADETQLLVLRARLSPVDATDAASTQPSQDAPLAELQKSITDATGSIDSLMQREDVTAVAKAQAAQTNAQATMDQAMSEASGAFAANPDLGAMINSAVTLQNRVTQLIGELAHRRDDVRGRLEQFRRTIDQLSRQRIEAIYEADSRIPQLKNELAAVRRKLQAAENADAHVSEDDRVLLQHQQDEFERELASEERTVGRDESAVLRERVTRLIAGAQADLAAQQQLIIDTLQALVARLNAAPPPPGAMSDNEKKSVIRVLYAVQNLAQAQSVYSQAIADAAPDADTIAALKDQIAELQTQADARQQVLSATPPADDAERQKLTAQLDDLTKRVFSERSSMEASHVAFAAAAQASIDSALTFQEGRKAHQTVDAMNETLAAKQEDMNAVNRSRDDLQATIDSTPDVKMPSERSVQVVWDDSGRKLATTAYAVIGIGIVFGILTVIAGRRRSVGGDPPGWQNKMSLPTPASAG